MKRKAFFSGLTAAIGMLVFILDGETALNGARDGVELCIQTVIPSLFPFFVLSIWMTNALSGFRIALLRPLAKLCGLPQGGESLLLTGFFGGYPAGAQCVSSAYRSGMLSQEDAQRVLAFCNNAGPAFLFGMITSCFPSIKYVWVLWIIHISSAVLVGVALSQKSTSTTSLSAQKAFDLPSAIHTSLRAIASVCGWVILFRVIIAFLHRWILWLLPAESQVCLIGLLELSNGCCMLAQIADVGCRFVVCSVILAFGGICVTMQTVSVIGNLSPKTYLKGKLMQAGFSLLFSCSIIYGYWIRCFIIVLAILFLIQKAQKKSSNQKILRV